MSISHQTVVQDQAAAIQADLYMSIELSDKKWQLTLSDGRRGPAETAWRLVTRPQLHSA